MLGVAAWNGDFTSSQHPTCLLFLEN